MDVVKINRGKKHSVKVITSSNQNAYISAKDAEMDTRASQAVKFAIEKAKICKKPVAKSDSKEKKRI